MFGLRCRKGKKGCDLHLGFQREICYYQRFVILGAPARRCHAKQYWTATEASCLMLVWTGGRDWANVEATSLHCFFFMFSSVNVFFWQKHWQCSICDSAGVFPSRSSKGSWLVQSYTDWLGQTDFLNEFVINVQKNKPPPSSLPLKRPWKNWNDKLLSLRRR